MNQRIDVVLRKFRSRLNSYPPGMCPLVLYRSLLQISINQSCGKCIPCRDGLVEADRLLGKILNGDGTAQTLQELQDLCQMIAVTADSPVNRITNAVFDEFARIPEYKVCAVKLEKMAGK